MRGEEAANISRVLAQQLMDEGFIFKLIGQHGEDRFNELEEFIFSFLKKRYGPDAWRNY